MIVPEFAGGGRDDDRIVSAFVWLGATSPETARPREATECQSPTVWELLRNKGVIREASPGLYYIDERRLPLRKRSNLGQTLVFIWFGAGVVAWLFGHCAPT